MSYFNIAGKSAGSIQIAHGGVWLSSNNVYGNLVDDVVSLSFGEPFLAFTLKRYNSIIEDRAKEPGANRLQGEGYALLRAKTPNTVVGTYNGNDVATIDWVRTMYETGNPTFNINEYLKKENLVQSISLNTNITDSAPSVKAVYDFIQETSVNSEMLADYATKSYVDERIGDIALAIEELLGI